MREICFDAIVLGTSVTRVCLEVSVRHRLMLGLTAFPAASRLIRKPEAS